MIDKVVGSQINLSKTPGTACIVNNCANVEVEHAKCSSGGINIPSTAAVFIATCTYSIILY